jgi:hypothetical protein
MVVLTAINQRFPLPNHKFNYSMTYPRAKIFLWKPQLIASLRIFESQNHAKLVAILNGIHNFQRHHYEILYEIFYCYTIR